MEAEISRLNRNITGPRAFGGPSLVIGGMVRIDGQRRLVKQHEGLLPLCKKILGFIANLRQASYKSIAKTTPSGHSRDTQHPPRPSPRRKPGPHCCDRRRPIPSGFPPLRYNEAVTAARTRYDVRIREQKMSMNPRWTYRRDGGLQVRMYFTMFMLAALYLFFVTAMMALGVPIIFVVVIAAVMLGIQYFASDKLVLRAMHAKVVTPEEQPELHAMIDRLVERADMIKPKVAVAMSDVPNAFATGRNQANALVCVTTGIMDRLDPDELEGVLAHELTHIKNNDVRVMTLASFFATVAAMLMNMLMWMSLFGGMGRHRAGGGNFGAALMLAYFVSILVYFIATMLILALSRYREYAADYGGAHLTNAPSKLASALQKISGVIARIPTDDLRKVESANAFFIVSALKGESLAGLFASHPPMEKRVARLHQLAEDLEGGR